MTNETNKLSKQTNLTGHLPTQEETANAESKSRIQYGLTILIELAEAYEKQGYPLVYIANKYNYPIDELIQTAHHLEKIGLIINHPDKTDWLILKNRPHCRWIFDMVSVLKRSFQTNEVAEHKMNANNSLTLKRQS